MTRKCGICNKVIPTEHMVKMLGYQWDWLCHSCAEDVHGKQGSDSESQSNYRRSSELVNGKPKLT